MSERVSDTLSERPSTERHELICLLLAAMHEGERVGQGYVGNYPKAMAPILAAFDAVTRERDEARAALTTIAGTTDCLDTSPDEIAKHVIGFSGAYAMEREHSQKMTRERDEILAANTDLNNALMKEAVAVDEARTVTDAMVERAVEAYKKTWIRIHESHSELLKEAFTNALTAALGAEAPASAGEDAAEAYKKMRDYYREDDEPKGAA